MVFPLSLTVKDFCSVTECTDLSVLEAMLNWRQNTVFIQEQFAGKHPEFEILMMGGFFSSVPPPPHLFLLCFQSNLIEVEMLQKIKVSIEMSIKKKFSYI